MNQTEPANDLPQLPGIVSSRLQTNYANFVRGLMTAEEIVLDFGFNPNSAGQVVTEQAELTSRIIMSPQSGARLYQLLHALLAKRQEAVEQAMARQKAQPAAAPPGATPQSE